MKYSYNRGISKLESMSNKKKQSVLEAEHSAANNFVKRHQMESSKMAGKNPRLDKRSMQFDSYMNINEKNAGEASSKLTKKLDKAFPVRK